MNKKQGKIPSIKYNCKWCGKDKIESNFFKCSVENGIGICKKCAKQKYNELNRECEKHIAILIMCHYLNIAFYFDIFKSLKIGEGIGYYIRQLNLTQNRNPDTFEQGILKNKVIEFVPIDMKIVNTKDRLSELLSDLEKVKMGIEDVKNDL